MNIKPLFDRVIIKEFEQPKTSNLILNATSDDKPIIGEVVCVGDGKTEEGKQVKMCVSIGDKVIFSKFCAVTIKIEGNDLFVLRQSDILGVLGEENE